MKFYYINLNNRKDRNKFFLNQFESSKIKLERIKAIEVSDLFSSVAPRSIGACWLSHVKCYETLIESRDEMAVIFEDDAIVDERLLKILESLDRKNECDYDLFQIGFLKDVNKITVDSGKIDIFFRIRNKIFRYWNNFKVVFNLQSLKNKEEFLFRNNSFQKIFGCSIPIIENSFEAGAHCYLISTNLAKKLIKMNRNPVVVATDLLLIEIAKSNKIKCGRLSKSLSFQNTFFKSDNLIRNKFMDQFKS